MKFCGVLLILGSFSYRIVGINQNYTMIITAISRLLWISDDNYNSKGIISDTSKVAEESLTNIYQQNLERHCGEGNLKTEIANTARGRASSISEGCLC